MRCHVGDGGRAVWLLFLVLTTAAQSAFASTSSSSKCDGPGCTACQLQCEPSFISQCRHTCTSCEAATGQRFALDSGTCDCKAGAGFIWQSRCSGSGGKSGSGGGGGGSKTFLPLQYQQVAGAWAAAKQQQAAADAAAQKLQELQAAVKEQAAKLARLQKQAATAAAARQRQRNTTSQQAAAFVYAGSVQTASPAVAAPAATSAAQAEEQLASFRAALQQLQAAKAAAAGAAHAASRTNATAKAAQRTAVQTEKRFWLHKRRRHQYQPPPSFSGDPSCYSWVPCMPCAAGTVSAGGAPAQSFCEPCPAGSKPNSDQSNCVPALPQPPSPPPPPPPPSKSNSSVKAPPRAGDVSAFTSAPRPVFVTLDGSGGVPPLTFSIVGLGPLRGQLEPINQARRRVLYTPAYAFCSPTGQPDEFQYMVTDSRGKTAKARAKVHVDCPGVACDNLWGETELRTPVELAAAVTGGAPPFEAQITYQPSGATITAIAIRGRSITFTYTPFANYCSVDGSSDYFEFEVTDRYGSTNTAAADVTVACPPVEPPALLLEMPAGGGVLAVDMQLDPGLAPYVFDLYQPPMNGDATEISTTGAFEYRPNWAYCSDDWPDVLSFTLYNVFGASADGSVSITVVCPPPPAFRPSAGDGGPVVFTTPALTAMSQQLEFEGQGRPLQVFTSVFPQRSIIEWQDADQGLFTYSPDDSFCSTTGQPEPWTFELVDIYDQRSSNTVFFKVLCPSPPVLTVDPAAFTAIGRVGLAVDMQLSSGGSLPPYGLVSVSGPKLGRFGQLTVSNNTSAMLKYIPRYGWCNENVTDTFTWRIFDRFKQQSGDATVSVTISCPPPPTAAAQTAGLAAGESLTVELDVTGQPPLDFMLSKSLAGQKKAPKVSANNTVTYSPVQGFCTSGGPPDVLRYRVFDVFGQTANGSVAFDVACPGGVPP